MLWHKTWMDTRLRFFAGFGLLTCAAIAIVQVYPRLAPLVNTVPIAPGPLGDQVREGLALASTFPGYVWTQWFSKTPVQLGSLFAIILGSGGLLSRGSQGAALFTLSLPISRTDLVVTRAAVGAIELMIMAFVPALLIPLTAPSIAESYSFGQALVYGVGLFCGSTMFFGLALALSTVWDDLWKPLLMTCALAVVLSIAEGVAGDTVRHNGVTALLTGEKYFRTGHVPWVGWIISAAVSSALVYGAAVNFENRDF